MGSRRISDPRWYDPRRRAWLDAPSEWAPMWLVLDDVDPSDGPRVTVRSQGTELDVATRWIEGAAKLVAEWPRADAGRHRISVRLADDVVWSGACRVSSAKLGDDAFEAMLTDLTDDLPAEIALALSRAGALSGLRVVRDRAVTLRGELERLRRVILGTQANPGVAAILAAIARDPHHALAEERLPLPIERVRRPVPTHLARTLLRPQDLLDGAVPRRLLDARRHRTLDTYENRVAVSLIARCTTRLRWVESALQGTRARHADTLTELYRALDDARRHARSLGDLSPLRGPPDRVTMVLLHRPPYRAALEAIAALDRASVVSLRDRALDAPLEAVPSLYQTWATLRALARLLLRAERHGWRLLQQRLARSLRGDVVIELLRDGVGVFELARGEDRVCVTPERSFLAHGEIQSATEFEQRPDLTIERRTRDGSTLWVLDPKYKLDADTAGTTRPVKSDVDKMHAYRDAIRGPRGERVVRFAAVLYPGETVWWGDELAALGAHPSRRAALDRDLDRVLDMALA